MEIPKNIQTEKRTSSKTHGWDMNEDIDNGNFRVTNVTDENIPFGLSSSSSPKTSESVDWPQEFQKFCERQRWNTKEEKGDGFDRGGEMSSRNGFGRHRGRSEVEEEAAKERAAVKELERKRPRSERNRFEESSEESEDESEWRNLERRRLNVDEDANDLDPEHEKKMDEDEMEELDGIPSKGYSDWERMRKMTDFSQEAVNTRDILREHLGPLKEFDPLANLISSERKEQIRKRMDDEEQFYPTIGMVEKPLVTGIRVMQDRDTRLYREIIDWKETYQMIMGVLHQVVNADQDAACTGCLEMIDIITDKMSNVNLERLSVRTSRKVADMIRNAGEDPVMRKSYKEITGKQAQVEQQLTQLTKEKYNRGRNDRLRSGRRTRRAWGIPTRSRGTAR
jgi:hypothetical protein